MKYWSVTEEVNLCAEHYKTVYVKANTKRKAVQLGEKKIMDIDGVFWVNRANLLVREVSKEEFDEWKRQQ